MEEAKHKYLNNKVDGGKCETERLGYIILSGQVFAFLVFSALPKYDSFKEIKDLNDTVLWEYIECQKYNFFRSS